MKLTIVIETGKSLVSEFTGTLGEIASIDKFDFDYHAKALAKAIQEADETVVNIKAEI